MLVQEKLILSQLVLICLIQDFLDGSGVISLAPLTSHLHQLPQT